MNDSDTEPSWIVDSPSTGPQQWILSDGKFAEVRLPDGRHVAVRDHPELDPLGVFYERVCEKPTCARIFPGEFRYCPFCRKELVPRQQAQAAPDLWWDAVANGFPEIASIIEIRAEGAIERSATEEAPVTFDPTPLVLPRGGSFAFSVAGRPPRLFAFDRQNCLLWARGLLKEEWIELGPFEPADPLPSWSWAAGEGPAGFAITSQTSLLWVRLPWQGKAPVKGASFCGRFLAGAGRSHTLLAVQMFKDDRLALAWRDVCRDDDWKTRDVDGWISDDENLVLEDREAWSFLGRPVQDARRNLYWAGRDGYLACASEEGLLSTVQWTRWPNGHRGRPEYRPVLDVNGGVYQLVFDTNLRKHFAERMSLSGVDAKAVDGPFFSSGHECFYERFRYAKHPWEPYSGQDVFETMGQIVIPLLAFRANEETRRAQQLFYARTPRVPTTVGEDARERFQVDVFLRRDDGLQIEFRRGFEIAWPSDLSMFYCDERVYLYDCVRNECWYWPVHLVA